MYNHPKSHFFVHTNTPCSPSRTSRNTTQVGIQLVLYPNYCFQSSDLLPGTSAFSSCNRLTAWGRLSRIGRWGGRRMCRCAQR